jgi:hypothetical protein
MESFWEGSKLLDQWNMSLQLIEQNVKDWQKNKTISKLNYGELPLELVGVKV